MIKKFTLFSFFLSLLITRSNAATCVALSSNDWENPATWSCGSVPTCGDSVVIPAFRVVTVTTQLDYSGCGGPMVINVFGELTFQSGKKMALACGSYLYVQTGGKVTGQGGGGSSNLIDICGNTAWTVGMGDVNGPAIIDQNGVTPLPVELLYFNANNLNNVAVQLAWATATETHNKHFEVERSKDGLAFSQIGTVNAAGDGNSLVQQYYEFADTKPFGGTSYYRLKQVDKNGEFEYLPIAAVTLGKKIFTAVYPNPAFSALSVSTTEENVGNTLQILTLTGQEVMSLTLESEHSSIDISSLQSGMYFLVSGADRIKLTVQK